jgi:hypothetical protein
LMMLSSANAKPQQSEQVLPPIPTSASIEWVGMSFTNAMIIVDD